jgi:hypothetical protein
MKGAEPCAIQVPALEPEPSNAPAAPLSPEAASPPLAVSIPPAPPSPRLAGASPRPAAPVPGDVAARAAPAGRDGYGAWPYVAGGAGVALLGTSLITGLVASSKADRLERECDAEHQCDPSLASVADSADTLAFVTDVLWISGAVAAGVGVTLFILSDDHAEPATALQTGCFAGGCGLTASGRF